MMGVLLAGLLAAQAPFVLAVGVNNASRADLPPLKFADDDAAAAAELFGAHPDRTFLLTTLDADSQERFSALRAAARPATRAQLKRAASELSVQVQRAAKAGERPVVLIWLVGHGAFATDGQPFVALEDGELTPAMLRDDVLGGLEAAHRVHVVMDACHSGAMVQWRAAVERAPEDEVNAQPFLTTEKKPGHVGVLTAAAAAQKTYEWDEIRSGIFSALTRAALRGAANADGDHCVSYDEVAAYVSAALQGISVPEARPQVVSRPPAVDHGAPLSCDGWFVPHASFSLAERAVGAFHLEDSRGVWLAGGHFEGGHQPDLWLPATGTLSLRTSDGEYPLQLAANTRVEMPAEPVQVRTMARGAVERAVEEGLFRVPYGPSFLNGYVASHPAAATEKPDQRASESRTRAPWLVVLAAVPAAGALLLVAAAAASSGVGAWQLGRYLTTDLQRPAAEARMGTIAGLVGAGAALVAAVLCMTIAGALAGAWLQWG